ncbi:GspH/FimT family pseudopilin [Pseudomonas chengduensis]|nr:GspH/FimT family pseudopilin [Pseudomonas chengduensis]MDH0959816.1 GspH/FimT family pseudopilin [Pseudomonas chengduensis]
MRVSKGFTLVELMVTLAVLAIILSIAVPSFADLIRSNRAESQRATLVNSLNLARSEAIRRSALVRVNLINGTTWTGGWRVWVDANNDNTYQTNEVIKEFPALTGGNTLTSTVSSIVFTSQGYLSGGTPGGSTTLQFRVGTGHCALERDIKINHLGRVSSERRAC